MLLAHKNDNFLMLGKVFLCFVFVCALLISYLALAEEEKAPLPWYEQSHDYVSDWIENVGIGMDRLLSRTRDVPENESFLRLRGGYGWQSLADSGFDRDIQAKLDLPNTQKKLRLVFSSFSEDEQSIFQQQNEGVYDTNALKEKDKSAFAALRWMLPSWQKWRPSMDVGVKTSVPLDPFVRFRLRNNFALARQWQLYTSHEVSYSHQKRLRSHSDFTLAKPIHPRVLWSNTWQLQWQKQYNHLEYGYILGFEHFITERDKIFWRAGAFYQQRPQARQQAYLIDMRYRRDLYKKWLFMEVIPAVQWLHENNFRDQYSLTLRLELLFKN